MSSSPAPQSQATSRKAKTIVWVTLAVLVVVGVMVFLIARAQSLTEQSEPEAVEVVREDSIVLSQAPNEQAVLVEFLDYECEACGAFYPVVEQLRAEYAETVTFVHRYFPLPGHVNSMNAAIAAEAAAQQGQYEAMYQLLFETQTQWGEATEDHSEVFRGFAEELGLEMTAYDAAVADPATRARVEADIADAMALGVSGTPTFFLDGQPMSVDSLEQFQAEIAAAATD